MIDSTNYKEYVDRFLAAETTLEDEQAMYRWFARHDIPAEARKLRPMFGWYADLSSTKTPQPKPRMLRIPARVWGGIAAAVAVVVTLGVWMVRPGAGDEYAAYAGSYMVVDGKRITDLAVVVPGIQAASADIERLILESDRTMEDANADIDRQVEASFHIDDPELAKIINSTINI